MRDWCGVSCGESRLHFLAENNESVFLLKVEFKELAEAVNCVGGDFHYCGLSIPRRWDDACCELKRFFRSIKQAHTER